MHVRKWLCYVTFVGLTLVAGCSSGGNLGKVSGRVTCQGQPVTNASIRFDPVKEGTAAVAQSAEGVTDNKGNYTLTTPGVGTGAAIGKHKAFVIYGDIYKAPPCKPPTDHVVEVKAGSNTIDIDLTAGK